MLADQEFSRHVQWITKQPEGEGNERKTVVVINNASLAFAYTINKASMRLGSQYIRQIGTETAYANLLKLFL